jgi:hypothetical protein
VPLDRRSITTHNDLAPQPELYSVLSHHETLKAALHSLKVCPFLLRSKAKSDGLLLSGVLSYPTDESRHNPTSHSLLQYLIYDKSTAVVGYCASLPVPNLVMKQSLS